MHFLDDSVGQQLTFTMFAVLVLEAAAGVV